jgi:hypothetical protein
MLVPCAEPRVAIRAHVRCADSLAADTDGAMEFAEQQ